MRLEICFPPLWLTKGGGKAQEGTMKETRKVRLRPQQQRFVDFYVLLDNVSEAARRAGYSAKGAPQSGRRLLKSDHVKAAIEEERRKLAADNTIDKQRFIRELALISFAKTKRFLTDDGKLKDLAELSEEAQQAVSRVWRDEAGKARYAPASLAERMKAMEQLARILGLNTPDVAAVTNIIVGDLDSYERARRLLAILERAAVPEKQPKVIEHQSEYNE